MTSHRSQARVLHVSSVYPPQIVGGAEKVVAMLAEAQAKRGQDVGAAYLTREPAPPGIRAGVATFPQTSRNLLWMEDVFRAPRPMRTANKIGQLVNARAADDFGRAIAEFRPDIVHTHSMVELPPMLWDRVVRSGARLVHTLHDYDLACSRASLFRNGRNCGAAHLSCRVTSAWKARYARAIDGISAVSQTVLDEHRRRGLFGALPPDRVRVIWNAAPAAAVDPTPRHRDGDGMVFGFLGRLVPEKGIETLLDACRLLPANGWSLRVAGRAQEGDAAYRARAAGLPVEFLGFSDPAGFLRSIDILVVPSIWREPFGLTVIEAFAQGVPVIGSKLGAIAELVGPIGQDWLVPSGDAAALAARMTRAIADGRGALPPSASYLPVLESVTPDRMVDAYDRLYATVLAG